MSYKKFKRHLVDNLDGRIRCDARVSQAAANFATAFENANSSCHCENAEDAVRRLASSAVTLRERVKHDAYQQGYAAGASQAMRLSFRITLSRFWFAWTIPQWYRILRLFGFKRPRESGEYMMLESWRQEADRE